MYDQLADSIGWSDVATVLPRGLTSGWRVANVWGIDPVCEKKMLKVDGVLVM